GSGSSDGFSRLSNRRKVELMHLGLTHQAPPASSQCFDKRCLVFDVQNRRIDLPPFKHFFPSDLTGRSEEVVVPDIFVDQLHSLAHKGNGLDISGGELKLDKAA